MEDKAGCCESPTVTSDRNKEPDGLVFRIEGMDCAEEIAILKQTVGPLVGGEGHLSFDLLHGRMKVLPDAGQVSIREIQKAVSRTGMKATLLETEKVRNHDQDRPWQSLFTLLSGLSLAAGLGWHLYEAGSLDQVLALFAGHKEEVHWPEKIAFGMTIVFGAPWVVTKAGYALLRLRPDMNLLMTLAVAGALALGEWFEAATVTFLFALALTLERWSVNRARRAVTSLLETAPDTARMRLENGEEKQVPVTSVPLGARVIVLPGEKIPVDGRVVAGESSVNQAPITGESVPVTKIPGEEVFAGTLNGEGVLEITVEKTAADTTLARIIRMVEEAHERKATVEQWVERFARIYTPVVFLAALLVWVGPPLLLEATWQVWFYRALVLLVIACPCALVISTPVSIVAALASSSRQGILVKGGVYLERPAVLKVMAFDKTGTLTCGEPAVERIVPIGADESSIVALAAALEKHSTHPVAEAFRRQAEMLKLSPPLAESVKTIAGRGVTGQIAGKTFWLGSIRFATEHVESWPKDIQISRLEQEGRTLIALGSDHQLLGLITLTDNPRPEAATAMERLRQLGIRPVMLTGDRQTVAEHIARQIGIEEIYAGLLPEAKVQLVEELTKRFRHVAMIGDGINDAPALARAEVGIAMGAIGSDAAIEAADIALMSDDLLHLPWLIRHARRTLWIIRENIAFALGVKAVFMGLAIMGQATLWMAVAADMGASLLVVANGLRLLRSKR